MDSTNQTGTFFVDTPLSITVKGRVKDEPKVVAYVKNMLTAVGLKTGKFVLVINTKIQSGGQHHEGIEIKELRSASGIRLNIQYGDNGTRFECFLSSSEFKPSDLRNLLTSSSKVIDGHYRKEEEHSGVGSAPVIISSGTSVLPTVSSDETPKTPHETSPSVSLRGSSQNTEDVELIITAIREKYGEDEFTQYEFHQIVVEKINANANRFVSGQLIRRLSEANHVKRISGKRYGEKKFQISSRSTTDKPSPGQITTLEKKIAGLKGQIGNLEKALSSLSACDSEIENLERSLTDARNRRESLSAEVNKHKSFIDNLVSTRVS
ncbi:MAG: hypothetical protein Q7R72_00165 [bacterium]|nr:hypothetical protein [bacterium]